MVLRNLIVMGFFFLLIEFLVAFESRSKRSVVLDKRGLCLRPAKNSRRSWETVRACHLESVPTLPKATKLTFEFGVKGGKVSRGRTWSMILSHDQVRQMVAELENQRAQHQLDFTINEHPQPRPKAPVSRSLNKMLWFMMIAFWFFIHGFPMMSAGAFAGQERSSSSSQSKIEFSPKREEQIEKFLFRYFHSMDQLRRGFLIGGGALCALAVVFYVVAIRIPVTFEDENGKPADCAPRRARPDGKA